jgi:hypothetical protein
MAMNLLAPLRTLRDERRQFGWKGLLRKRGWKLLLALFVFYLIRDVVLYILMPLGLAAWLIKVGGGETTAALGPSYPPSVFSACAIRRVPRFHVK